MTNSELSASPQTPHMSTGEAQARLELAAVYRMCAQEGWDELIYNHAAMRIPGEDCFLVKRHDLLFKEVRASNLLKLRWDGRPADESQNVNAAGFTIHTAVLRSRSDVNCTIHVHTEAGLVMAARKPGLQPIYQGAMQFYNRLSYHEYEGLASDVDEAARIGRDLGPRNRAMILRHHGLLTCGANAAEALSTMRYLVQACEVQTRIDAGGGDFDLPSPAVCERTAEQWEHGLRTNAPIEWAAQLRMLDGIDPSYRQ